MIETGTPCFAWALIPNHLHLLMRTGLTPIATVMQRLLTRRGYAVSFNHRHRRHGHLFQNRYKSILCQEDLYLLELVRYIHLNPLRARLVKDLKDLDKYPYCGHNVLMGKRKRDWQDADYILKFYDSKCSTARRRYRKYVEKGIADIKILCTTFVVQMETGGNLTKILDGLSKTIRDRFKLKMKVKAMTAEGRITSF